MLRSRGQCRPAKEAGGKAEATAQGSLVQLQLRTQTSICHQRLLPLLPSPSFQNFLQINTLPPSVGVRGKPDSAPLFLWWSLIGSQGFT